AIMRGFLAPPSPTLPPASALLDQLQLAYILLDRQGLLVEVNETLLSLTGYTRAEVLARAPALAAATAARCRRAGIGPVGSGPPAEHCAGNTR
nr:hypothetical protein [Tanacetum cinerariifolium]